jgi:hypothetical protein
MRKKFYKTILPTQGLYCVTKIKQKKATNYFVETIDEIEPLLNMFGAQGFDVFVAVSTFKNHSRRAENALFTRSMFIDIDVGAEAHKYQSKQEALQALDDFLDVWNVPPPIIVESGNGVHAYWAMAQDIPSEEWLLYAKKFKEFCLSKIKIDATPTADRARPMRAPDTLNYKYTPPVLSCISANSIPWNIYDFDDFKDFLGRIPEEVQDKLLATIPKGLDEDTQAVSGIDPNIENSFAQLAQRSLDDEGGCNQIKHIILNAKTLSEPLWRAGLSIARTCVDWEESIQLMSQGHPGYNRDDTIVKAEGTLDRTTGKPHPYLCTTLETLNPGGCANCPYKGKISSPIYIARKAKEPPLTALVTTDPKNAPLYTSFPKELGPYSRAPNGGVLYTPPPKRGKDGELEHSTPFLISTIDFYPTRRLTDKKLGEILILRSVPKLDPPVEIDFLSTSLYTDEANKQLPLLMLHHNHEHLKLLKDYILTWTRYLAVKEAAEQVRAQMGWVDEVHGVSFGDGFVAGSVEIRRDGSLIPAAASAGVRQVAKHIYQQGEYQLWKNSANKLSKPGYELHAFALFVGFGSPLVVMTNVQGGSVIYVAPSGAGKSGALYAAQSIWGNPKGLTSGNAKEGGTNNALRQLQMWHKNIAFGLDEAGSYEAEELSAAIHQITQGEQKKRMESSSNTLRELEQRTAGITLWTANHSVIQKIQLKKHDPTGEIMRAIEFTLVAPPTMDHAEGADIFNPFTLNFGFAGVEYVQYVFSKGEAYVKAKLAKWSVLFYQSMPTRASLRFYEAIISSAFTGAELANEAGIIDIPLMPIHNVVMANLVKMLGEALAVKDNKEVIGLFMNAHINAFVVSDRGNITREARGHELLARIEVYEEVILVAVRAFKKYMQELQLNTNEVINDLETRRICRGKRVLRLAKGWAGMGTLPPVDCYLFKMDKADIQEILNDISDDSDKPKDRGTYLDIPL